MAGILSRDNSGIDLIVSYNANEDDGYAERERSRSEAKQKRKRSCKRTGVLVCRVVVMAVIVASYILLGGLVIMRIESPPEMDRIRQAKEANRTVRESIITLLAPLADFDYNRSSELAEQLIANISAASALGAFQPNILESWDYAQSVFFVGTTITTIGRCTCLLGVHSPIMCSCMGVLTHNGCMCSMTPRAALPINRWTAHACAFIVHIHCSYLVDGLY